MPTDGAQAASGRRLARLPRRRIAHAATATLTTEPALGALGDHVDGKVNGPVTIARPHRGGVVLDPSALATRFERFAALEADGHSRLYGRLARAVAADRELLSLAARAAPGQPPPNL